jgi:hypothetical protein
MSDMVHEGTARLLVAIEYNPAGCPVRDGHPRMHSECAVCGEQPPARVEAARAVKAWGLGSEAWADRILHPEPLVIETDDDPVVIERGLLPTPAEAEEFFAEIGYQEESES